MKLIQLRYLVAVAENDLNITHAARVLHAAQPGVSKQLKQLEDELGFQLFERKGRALIRPTDAGNKVIDRASQIVRQARSIKALAAELRKDDAGALSIATTHTQARYVLPQVLKRFREKYPKVRLHLHQGNSEQIADLAASDRIDFAIATGNSPIFSGLVRLPCYRWHRCIVVPDGTSDRRDQPADVRRSRETPAGHLLLQLLRPGIPGRIVRRRRPDAQRRAHRLGFGRHQEICPRRTRRRHHRQPRHRRRGGRRPQGSRRLAPVPGAHHRGRASAAARCCVASCTTSCRCWRRT
jgi:DNA-binding transcriptional LysR family regulator